MTGQESDTPLPITDLNFLEKYLWFDVPVEDFSIVHMFKC